jgi:hypothetical protein
LEPGSATGVDVMPLVGWMLPAQVSDDAAIGSASRFAQSGRPVEASNP